MSRFAQIAKGAKARKVVGLPLGDGPPALPTLGPDGLLVMTEAPGVVSVALRPLTAGEQADVLSRARAYAVAKGVPSPAEGDPIYDLAVAEETLALACLDPDAPDAPFFGSVEEIRSAPELGRDRVIFLYAAWDLFQDECSPSLRKVGAGELMASLKALAVEEASEAERFFGYLGPGLRWICMRTLARLWATSQQLRSASSSPSEAPPTSTSEAPGPGGGSP